MCEKLRRTFGALGIASPEVDELQALVEEANTLGTRHVDLLRRKEVEDDASVTDDDVTTAEAQYEATRQRASRFFTENFQRQQASH